MSANSSIFSFFVFEFNTSLHSSFNFLYNSVFNSSSDKILVIGISLSFEIIFGILSLTNLLYFFSIFAPKYYFIVLYLLLIIISTILILLINLIFLNQAISIFLLLMLPIFYKL